MAKCRESVLCVLSHTQDIHITLPLYKRPWQKKGQKRLLKPEVREDRNEVDPSEHGRTPALRTSQSLWVLIQDKPVCMGEELTSPHPSLRSF